MAGAKTSRNAAATPSGTGTYFTIPEVAKMLGISERWLADQCRDENIAHVYIARKRRFTSAQVDDLVRRYTKTPITMKAVDAEAAAGRAAAATPTDVMSRSNGNCSGLADRGVQPSDQHLRRPTGIEEWISLSSPSMNIGRNGHSAMLREPHPSS